MILNWKVSKEDHELISQIATRAKEIARRQGTEYSWHDATMDLTAAHANGNPLDLAGLLKADDYNFTHDVFGIAAHLDHETGKLTNGGVFNPRYRVQEAN
jgi:Family of unknown function (DUF6874)